MLHITTKSIPVKAAESMSIVKRYQKPLRRAYTIIMKEFPDTEKSVSLEMAVKYVNDSVGPDGLVPKLLVFGAFPLLGLPKDQPTPSTFKRAVALRKAIESMSRHFASRQVRDSITLRNGPNVTDTDQTPIGSKVLMYGPALDR